MIESKTAELQTKGHQLTEEREQWAQDKEAADQQRMALQKEKEEAMAQAQEYAGAFQTGNPNQGDNGGGE